MNLKVDFLTMMYILGTNIALKFDKVYYYRKILQNINFNIRISQF